MAEFQAPEEIGRERLCSKIFCRCLDSGAMDGIELILDSSGAQRARLLNNLVNRGRL
jgi:hypothetical protein